MLASRSQKWGEANINSCELLKDEKSDDKENLWKIISP